MSVALDISDRSQIEREIGGRAADVDAVTRATRILARSVDATTARMAVCEAASTVAEAPVAALFEPGIGDGGLVATAAIGADFNGLQLGVDSESGAALAFGRAEEIFIARSDQNHPEDAEFLRRARANAVLWHPVIRERAAVGVLAIAWHEGLAGVSLRLSAMIDLLGAEAAVAIGRADLLAPARVHGSHRRPHRASQPPLLGAPPAA